MKKLCTFLLCLVLALGTLPLTAAPALAAVVASGTFGDDNLTWTLDDSGTLSITGSGAIPDYGQGGRPWDAYAAEITTVTLGPGITELGRYALSICNQCTSITVDPANPAIKDVNGVVFSADGATLIQYPAGISGSYAVPSGTSEIAGSAVQGARDLTDVTLPTGLTRIGAQAFYGCRSLSEVEIPADVAQIESRAFASSGLQTITVDANNPAYKSMDGVLFSADGATLIAFPAGKSDSAYEAPAGVTEIFAGAFEGCGMLERVALSNGLQRIGGSAFSFCRAMTDITLPDSVTDILPFAFSSCTALTDVWYGGTQTLWDAVNLVTNGNDPLLNATIHFGEKVAVQPSDPAADPWITEAVYNGDTLTLTAKAGVGAPVFLAAHDGSNRMTGVCAGTCVNGKYTISVGADAGKYRWKLLFVDADAFAPLTCDYALVFPAA